jgi:hypothetical protein
MNEYVLVEFIARGADQEILRDRLRYLPDVEVIGTADEYEMDDDSYTEWTRITAKVESQFLSMIKLQDSFLAERMRISYIPEELKNKYRR